MKTHRFIVPFEIRNENILVVSDFEIVHQITHVLRLQKNEKLIVCNGNGQEYLVSLNEITPSQARLIILEKVQNQVEQKRKVTLYACILKGEHFELVAQKATELGISALVPVTSERTIKLNIKIDRIQKIMKESAEQSGRNTVPLLFPPLSFKESLHHSQNNQTRYFFDLHAPEFSAMKMKDTSSIAGFIGPEGGWHENERTLAEQNGCQVVSLGPATLRAETAGIISCFLLCQ